MARLTRNTSIVVPQSRGQQITSVGPALLNLGSQLQKQAFDRGADKRTAEAQLAAASLNFERDGEGNLLAPALPIGENGLVAPTIYDQEYSAQVFRRYAQQSELDASAMMAAIARDHPFDPDGFDIVAKAYIDKITELAPDLIKSEINMNAQVKSVEHFNFIARMTAERDYNNAALTHETTVQTAEDALTAGMMAGDLPETTEIKYQAQRDLIVSGNFLTGAQKDLQLRALDITVSTTAMLKTISEIDNTELDFGKAMAEMKNLANGEGEVTAMGDDGKMHLVPIAEAYPNPKVQAGISAAAQVVLKNRMLALTGLMNAQQSEQNIDYVMWHGPHQAAVDEGLKEFNFVKANQFLLQAVEARNSPLVDRIRENMASNRDTTGMNKEFTDYFDAADIVEKRRAVETERAIDLTPENFRLGTIPGDAPPIETEEEIEQLRRSIEIIKKVPFSYTQTKSRQKIADKYLEEFMAQEGNESFDPFTSDWPVVQLHINQNVRGQGDLIAKLYTNGLNNIFSDIPGNIDSYDRGLALAFEFMRDPGTRRNLKGAMEPAAFNALAYIFTTRAPGENNIRAETTQDMINKFSDPGYTPHPEWGLKTEDELTLMMETFRNTLSSYIQEQPFMGMNKLEGTQVPIWHGGFANIFGTNLEDEIPHEVQVAMFNSMRSESGMMDGKDAGQHAIAMRHSMNNILHEFGYAASEFGFNRKRASTDDGLFGQGRADYALVRLPPEYWYRDDGIIGLGGSQLSPTDQFMMQAIGVDFQNVLNKLSTDTGSKKYIAGQTAWLEFDLNEYYANGTKQFRVKLFDEGPDRIIDALDESRGVEGNVFFINFEEYGTYERARGNRLRHLERNRLKTEANRVSSQRQPNLFIGNLTNLKPFKQNQ